MKVAVTDYSFDSLDVEKSILEPLGCQVVSKPRCRDEAELIGLVADADAVITQFAPLTPPVIQAMQRARVIARYGIGVDNVDLEAARARNIPVCNVPDYCIDEVADHTLGLILALTRQLVPLCLNVRAGRWSSPVPLSALHALKHLTVGVVGFGRIGREVTKRLQAFKCKVLVFDPVVPAAEIERAGCTPSNLEALLPVVDLLTLHCPSTPQTRGMLNSQTLPRMKQGAILINVSRGDLVETAALIEALQTGRLSAAGLDVCNPEPVPADSPLLRMDQVLLTPHIASASVPAVTKLRTSVAQTVASAVRGELVGNVVNGVKGSTSPRNSA